MLAIFRSRLVSRESTEKALDRLRPLPALFALDRRRCAKSKPNNEGSLPRRAVSESNNRPTEPFLLLAARLPPGDSEMTEPYWELREDHIRLGPISGHAPHAGDAQPSSSPSNDS